MKRIVIVMSVLALFLLNLETYATEIAPYSGQETREIKALSASDIDGLLSGEGMGYAKAAELNGYPGPAHVLELGEKLGLTVRQRAETRRIFERMQNSAQELGVELVAAERALDQMFRNKSIDESSLSELVTKIGRIESRLRATHLNAHLQQRQLLSERQITKYMMLRGYNGIEHAKPHHNHDG